MDNATDIQNLLAAPMSEAEIKHQLISGPWVFNMFGPGPSENLRRTSNGEWERATVEKGDTTIEWKPATSDYACDFFVKYGITEAEHHYFGDPESSRGEPNKVVSAVLKLLIALRDGEEPWTATTVDHVHLTTEQVMRLVGELFAEMEISVVKALSVATGPESLRLQKILCERYAEVVCTGFDAARFSETISGNAGPGDLTELLSDAADIELDHCGPDSA